ncbi:MAG: DNA recombination protein RmuC [Defluviicoccus sp.]|nr:DNA recombination protein RmuC [Defluviicoccus sp.]
MIAALLGLAAGAAIVWLARRGEMARLAAARDAERQRADSMARDLEAERVALAASRSRTEEAERAQREKIAALERVRGDIEKELKALAQQALKDNQTSFLGIANEVFDKHRERVDGELKPIKTALAEWRKNLEEIEKTRREHYGSLTNELKNVVDGQERVRGEAARLVNALRAAPKTRGRWGEETLRNVLELSGMTEHCDFVREQSLSEESGVLRPDVIIRLPGERYMVVDAKTSLAAYLDAMEAEDEDTREAHMERHARQLRTHMRRLGEKAYWEACRRAHKITPDFVVMFVPGDNFYAAAIERYPELYEEALRSNVLIVTPTVMLGLAKTVAFGWRQEKVADNAREVARLGQVLYQRMSTMGGHIVELGKDIARSVGSYNEFVGSLETRVMPQARRFSELEVEGASRPLAEARPIDTDIRLPREDRDLAIGASPESAVEPRPPVSPAAE